MDTSRRGRSSQRRSKRHYYTIVDLMVVTGLDRTTLLQIINGRADRNTAPLVSESHKRIRNINGRWTMTYSEQTLVKLLERMSKRKTNDKRYKDTKSKQRQSKH